MKAMHRWGWTAAPFALAGLLAATGCGTPGAPLPPSLNLPDTVTDLAAIRSGNQVSLTWKMPKRTTDKLLLKGDLPVRVCRRENAETCVDVPSNLLLAPGSDGAWTDALPPSLASGAPRPLTYFVELKNRNGRSAGLSNAAVVLAGAAPAPLTGVAATVIKTGVVLRWNPDGENTAVRLHRKLLTPQPDAASGVKPQSQHATFAPEPEPSEQTLLVEPGASPGRAPDHALDKSIRFGQTFEYRAQRVARVSLGSQTLELAGELSAPVRVEATDVFPPAVPTGLAAIATVGENGTETAIDLSWQPGADADLAGYQVYRRESANEWQRISPAQPLAGPAFHDDKVQPGHTYRYAVSAIDQSGHESARSAEAEETVPNP